VASPDGLGRAGSGRGRQGHAGTIHRIAADRCSGCSTTRPASWPSGSAGRPFLKDFVRMHGLVATMKANDADQVEIDPAR
jgi:hypothetical protein